MLKLNFRTAAQSKTTRCLILLAILATISLFAPSPSAFAYTKGANSTTDKIVAKALETCYNGLQNTIKLLDAQDFLKYKDSYKNKIFSDTSLSVPVPNINFGVEGTAQSNPKISCIDFLFGSSNWAGIANATFNSEASLSDAKAFLEKLQYTATAPGSGSDNTDRVCLSVSRTIIDPIDGSTSASTTNKICTDVHEEDGVAYVEGAFFTDWTPIRDIWMRVDGTGHEIEFGNNNGVSWMNNVSTCAGRSNTCKWDDIVSAVQSEISLAYDGNSFVKVVVNADTPDFSGGNTGGNAPLSDSDIYTKGSAASAIAAITGESGSLALSNAEIYSYYVKYLSNGKYITVSCEDNFNYSDPWKNIPKIKYGGEITNKCYYLEKDRIKYTIADADKFMIASANIESVISALNSMDLAAIKDDIADLTPNASPSDLTDDDPASPGTLTTGTDEFTCGNSGGAGSLGWIVCPIMEWAANAAEDIYNNYVKPSLQIEPQLFRTDTGQTNSNAHAAWSVFRDFANIVFAIFLLIVIFSQLTGIGIDNYGIKKTLPNLIVAAILVNVSYYICVGVIDISNIVGNSIQGLFKAIPTGSPADIDGVTFSSGIGSTSISAVAIGVALFAAGKIIWTNPAIVLTLLISLIGLIISIFFLFILLTAREAMVVVLTVLSPIAFVCYMLPNTKSTYDKWFKALKALLLVYPICGLLVGGGDWLSRLLLSNGYGAGGITKAFMALAVGIMPIFFIPTTLKNSMSALGGVGAKFAGLGKTFSSGLTKHAKNSNLYKNVQQRGLERKVRISAGIDRHGNARNFGRFQRIIHGGSRNIARNRVVYNKQQDILTAYEAAMDPHYVQNQNELREDKNRKMREDAIIAQITRNGQYGGRNYGVGGKDLNAMYGRFVQLSNLGDNISQAERDERGAIYRKLASEKQGINVLNESIYHVGEQGHLSTAGLRAMNAHRVQNADVAAALARKDTTGNMYLDDFAAGATTDPAHANGVLTSAEISARYAPRALSDNQRIADQSGAALARHIHVVAPDQLANLVNDSNFRQIVTDAGNQRIIEDAHRANAQRHPN